MLRLLADAEPSSATLLRLVNGYQVSQAIHVAATLGIAEQLAAGPRAVGDLAGPGPPGQDGRIAVPGDAGTGFDTFIIGVTA